MATQAVRRDAAEIIRRIVAEIIAGNVIASPALKAYLTGLADGLDA